jgi:negative regulator of sigma E activity
MTLESHLRDALRRESPPTGFASRVMDRIAEEEMRSQASPSGRSTHRRWRAVAASLMLATLLGGYSAHRIAEQRRIEGEQARDQVLLAMRITGEKMRYAQQEVRSIGTRHSND